MSFRTPFLVLLTVLGLIAPASTQAGDHPHVRDRVVLGLNLGGGSAKATFESDDIIDTDEDRLGGVAASFRFAVAMTPTKRTRTTAPGSTRRPRRPVSGCRPCASGPTPSAASWRSRPSPVVGPSSR